jgi:hypothetical protein
VVTQTKPYITSICSGITLWVHIVKLQPHRQKATVGNEPSSQSHQGSFLLDLSPSSLAKIIARDRAMSTLDALANYLIKKREMHGSYSGLSSKFICIKLVFFPKNIH